ncbi:MAG: sensor histidine kinase [Acidimicrobiia bacterium]
MLSAVVQFGVIGLAAAAAVAVIALETLSRAGASESVNDASDRAELIAEGIVRPHLTPDLIAGNPEAIAVMDDVTEQLVLRGGVVRLKVWDFDGTIVYSDQHELIGRTFAIEPDVYAAMVRNEPIATVSSLDEDENELERATDQTELLEVYRPIMATDGRTYMYEDYQRLNDFERSADRNIKRLRPLILASLLTVVLVQVPAGYWLGRRVRRNERQRAALLQRALEAGDLERRRFGRDLHDGVVQDLIGLSYAVGGVLKSDQVADPVVRQLLEEVSETTKASVLELRASISEIYPPALRERSLADALQELCDGLVANHVAATLVYDVQGALEEGVDLVLYRVAHESIQNVRRHANATDVAVRVVADPRTVTMTIRDNGRGFDVANAASRVLDDHFGLPMLRDLMTDVGGSLEVQSEVDTGTVVTAVVPR